MRSATFAFGRIASLILPIASGQEDNVYAPDDYRVAGLNRLRGVDEVTPDDIPTGMIVVRLYRPRPCAAFGL